MATSPKRLWTAGLLTHVDTEALADITNALARWETQPDLWAWVLQALRDGRGLTAFHHMIRDESARWGLSPQRITALMEAATAYQSRSLSGPWRFLVRKPVAKADLPRIFAGLDGWHGTIPDIVRQVQSNPYLLIQVDAELLREWFPHIPDRDRRQAWMHFLDRVWAKAPHHDPAMHQTWREWAAVLGVLIDRYQDGDTYLYLQHPRFAQRVRPHLDRVRTYLQQRQRSDSDVQTIIRRVIALCESPQTPVTRSYRIIQSRDAQYEKIAWMWIYMGEKSLADQTEKRLQAPLYPWPAVGDSVLARGYQAPGTTTYVPFDPDQMAAVRHAYTHPLTVLAAPPGTGKTAVIWALHEIARQDSTQHGAGFFVFTPTGRAARVVNDRIPQLARPARTLHSAVATWTWSPSDSPAASLADQVGPGFVTIDEAFNADAGILGALVRHLGTGGRLVLIGDPDQLLPVTGGSPVFDILKATQDAINQQLVPSHRNPTATLHHNHRSVAVIPHNGRALWGDAERDPATHQPLIDASTNAPVIAQHRWDALHFPRIPLPPEADAVETALLEAVRAWEQDRPPDVPSEQQWHVVTRYRAAAQYLNQRIRTALFPDVSAPWIVGDRVLQLHNDYQLNGIGLRNGEFGHILQIDPDTITAAFASGTFTVPMQYANIHWEFGYVTTVYKAQGGEWPVVAVVDWPKAWVPSLPDSHPPDDSEEAENDQENGEDDPNEPVPWDHRKWNRRELYTAWSRARDVLLFLSPHVDDAILDATRDPHAQRDTNGGRQTQLRGWLRYRFQSRTGPRPGGPAIRRTL